MTVQPTGRLPVAGITFDFGNTLVRVDRAGLHQVLEVTAAALEQADAIHDRGAFTDAWRTERDRQFRVQVPQLLEVDLAERVRHVLAALRGAAIPRSDAEPWDETHVSRLVDEVEVELAIEAYSEAFVAGMAPLPGVDSVLAAAAGAGFRLGVLSNWPLARTVDRYVLSQGWDRWLGPIVVSQRVGVIKPHPAIFAAAASALALPPGQLLHVGDDWAADVVGGRSAGWHVAYLRGHQGDTPLPTSERGHAGAEPDLELDDLGELLAALEQPLAAATGP